ncbi:MAG: tetratricopeptide repeat protein [Alphaproteobacteria bacterium]
MTEEEVEGRFNAAVGLHRAGRAREAASVYREILAARAGHGHAAYNLGVALRSLGRTREAIEIWSGLAEREPDRVDALLGLSRAYRSLNDDVRSLDFATRAAALRPQSGDAHNLRSNALRSLGRNTEALAALDAAVAAEPGYALAHSNRGHLLSALKRHAEAVGSYRAARALEPSLPDLTGALLDQQMRCCDWRDFGVLQAEVRDGVRRGEPVTIPFTFLAHNDDPADQMACVRTHLKGRFPDWPPAVWTGQTYHHDRIRVGYVSSDLRVHAVAQLLVGLLERHDRSRFEIHAYALPPQTEDDMRARVQAACEAFHDVSDLDDAGIAAALRADEIDIAIDLNGFTTHCRPGVFVRRCAPVQINYLGYPGAMGAVAADYILADHTVIPKEESGSYDEKIIRLPFAYQPNDDRRVIADKTPTRAEAALPETGFVFCSFNASYKITPPVFDVWMQLLHEVPGSVLWLLGGDAVIEANLRREAVERGVDASRLVFAPKAPLPEHLARHRLADLFLDTLPYNAHTTASDALWAGLPLVTCTGRSFAARVAASLLRATGLPDLVTASLEDYRDLALALARDPARLAALKARLAANLPAAPLFDTDRTRRQVETAYEIAWRRRLAGLEPCSFDVPEDA